MQLINSVELVVDELEESLEEFAILQSEEMVDNG